MNTATKTAEPIRLRTDAPGVHPQEREAIVGRWYLGVVVDEDDTERGEELMRYDGEGVWSSDDPESENDPYPGDYDYLQEQF